jgi:hypothetical protein
MQKILQEVRVDGDTYITDEHNTEITTAEVGNARYYWNEESADTGVLLVH